MLTSVYALIVVLLLFADGQDPRRLDRLEAAVDGAALPPGWNLRAVGGEPLAHTVVEDSDGTTSLLMVADSAAGQAWLELEEDLDPRTGTLSWEWSVADRPTGTSLRDPAADDSGLASSSYSEAEGSSGVPACCSTPGVRTSPSATPSCPT